MLFNVKSSFTILNWNPQNKQQIPFLAFANGTRPTRRRFGAARSATRWPPSNSINTRITTSTRSKIIPKWTVSAPLLNEMLLTIPNNWDQFWWSSASSKRLEITQQISNLLNNQSTHLLPEQITTVVDRFEPGYSVTDCAQKYPSKRSMFSPADLLIRFCKNALFAVFQEPGASSYIVSQLNHRSFLYIIHHHHHPLHEDLNFSAKLIWLRD